MTDTYANDDLSAVTYALALLVGFIAVVLIGVLMSLGIEFHTDL